MVDPNSPCWKRLQAAVGVPGGGLSDGLSQWCPCDNLSVMESAGLPPHPLELGEVRVREVTRETGD